MYIKIQYITYIRMSIIVYITCNYIMQQNVLIYIIISIYKIQGTNIYIKEKEYTEHT